MVRNEGPSHKITEFQTHEKQLINSIIQALHLYTSEKASFFQSIMFMADCFRIATEGQELVTLLVAKRRK